MVCMYLCVCVCVRVYKPSYDSAEPEEEEVETLEDCQLALTETRAPVERCVAPTPPRPRVPETAYRTPPRSRKDAHAVAVNGRHVSASR